MDLKSTLYQKLSEQDKQNIKELTNKYKTSDYTLAEIFNVKSEIYKNIPLSQLCLSARVVSHRAWLKSDDLVNWEPFTNNLSTQFKDILGDFWKSGPSSQPTLI